jgi:HAD superfamily hydrolase (TIGR01509 family)
MSVAAPPRQRSRPAARPKKLARSRAQLRTHRHDAIPLRKRPPNLEALSAHWWAAFDAAEKALERASMYLPAEELRRRHSRLVCERESTVRELEALARTTRVPSQLVHLLVSRSGLRRLLGLPAGVSACVFNLDGVLVDSATVHAAAWTETFDEFISARVERTRGRFPSLNEPAPFDPRTDYWAHIHGRPRLDGVREFLASRGISLPEGDARDPPDTETVYGLANRKREALVRRLDERGVAALEGSRRYLELARTVGVHRAIVSASANTDPILGRSGLADLIESRVDGNTIAAEHLRMRPAPDILLFACKQLGVQPEQAAVFETSPAGIEAAHAGGFGLVFGVAPNGQGDALRANGADLVVIDLASLLEQNLGSAR